ncbi:MAG: response regulator [Bacteroidota bacterium]
MHTAFDVRAQKPRVAELSSSFDVLFSGQNTYSETPSVVTETAPDTDLQQKTRKILLVEDNLINQKVALRILAQHGYVADTAINGQEALEAFKSKAYDLVLMDIQMPIMDGISATRSIRDKFGSERPYIIAVTANVTPEDQKNCYEAGMNDFVTKPIRSDVLLAAIDKAPPPQTDQ